MGNGKFLQQLTSKELQIYLQTYKKSKEAREKLILHNLALVAYISKKYRNLEEYDDLIQIGIIGLIRGVDSFKNEENHNFRTYITRCIENEIFMHLRKINKGKKQGSKSNKKIKIISLNTTIFQNEEITFSLGETLASDQNLEEDYILKEERQNAYQFLSNLSDTEKEMIKLKIGFYNEKCYTQPEIARLYNVSQSYVSKVIINAYKKIRQKEKIKVYK